MVQQPLNIAYSDGSSHVLSEDHERVFSRGWRLDDNGNRLAVLLVAPAADQPSRSTLDRLTHEYELRNELDTAWAMRPLALMRDASRIVLVLDDLGGEPLDRLLGRPMEIGRFLRLAIAVTSALGKLHQRGLIHKDIKPTNIVVDCADGHARLTGFGIASRLSRERQAPEPPETIAGTLAYMAPEQTGRMNRSIDTRSDLYALGVTLYQMLTGVLPFTAADPMEWVHCHIARKPIPPAARSESVPAPVSAIVMKLLAKTPEDRYQTAEGVERDLRRCLAEWESRRRIDDFPLGLQETPGRLLIPEKLYGRASAIDTLLSAFDRVVGGGRPELVLVSGYSGIGKSAVVDELHKPLVPPRGLFASGKFDQYKRDIPYATLAQAFQSLIRPLLNKPEAELREWRDALLGAVGPNGLLIVDLVPELKHIIGEQPPVPELPPKDAQGRFHLVFRRFISVFARPEHPLALFLDDLQWLDAATLDLLEDLLTRRDVQNLLLIGAYRDNEVDPTHPLMRKLEAMRQAGAILQDIVLAPLTCEDLEQLVADSLRSEPERITPLAQLIHEKTTGNPFFAIQFISGLADEGLITFDHDEARWCWDLNRIHAKGYTDNVVDLMVEKLNRLSAQTRNAMQKLACLGNDAAFTMLRIVYQDSEEEMHDQLWEAVQAGLIFRSENSYKFLHDRVQEAAYSLIPGESRAEVHLRIGMLLATKTPPEKVEETIFEIVNQLNRGSHLIVSIEELERVAELNLIAGRRAKTSAAYASALKYFAAGRALLTEATWNRNYELNFEIEFSMAECELLTADMVAAENRLSMLSERARTPHHVSIVTRLRLTLYQTTDRSDRAVEVCLEYLRCNGTDWSPHPTSDEVQREYDRIWSQLGNRQIEELVDLPLITSPELLDVLDILGEFQSPAMCFDKNLLSLVLCRMVNLSLEHGNSDSSCFGYVWFAIIAGPFFGNYRDGYRFGRLGYELVKKRSLTRYQARTYMSFGNIVLPWAKHALGGRDLVRHAFDAAYRIGDLQYAAYCCCELVTNFLTVGDPLAEVLSEAENALAFVKRAQFGLVIDLITAQVGIIRTLRGLTPKFGCFDDEGFDELEFERHLASSQALRLADFWYCARKVQARFFAGDYATAVDASLRAQRLLWTSPSQFETAEFRFYGALSHAAAWDSASSDQRQRHFEALTAHHRQLEIWAEHCPENFENRAALVGAEIARIEGRLLDAERFYEEAIRSARANGFVHNEALAYELAARFYAARGFEEVAHLYLGNARRGYLRWGADGKVRQLDQLHPRLRQDEHASGSTGTIETQVEQLDLAAIIEVSQALSGEMVLEKLIDKLMRAALERSGAERGLLIVPQGDELRIKAEAITSEANIKVHLPEGTDIAAALPESLVRYATRTHETALLDDASSRNLFSGDPYIVQRRARSILCLPLINQRKLIGILYLENNLAPNVFTPGRVALLKVLASQAAISLENSRLYDDLADREGRIRRLVDANIVGIFIADREGRFLEANDAFLRLVGYGREDLISGRVRWTELSPPEWRERHLLSQAELNSTGNVQPFEKEYFRKDGSRVPVLVGAALLKKEGHRLAFVVDLTERKRAEDRLRRTEAWLSQAESLSHSGTRVYNATTDQYIYWSDESYRIWGLDPQQGLPSRDDMFRRIHPDDRNRVSEKIQEIVRQKLDFAVFDFRILFPDGTIKYVELASRQLFSSEGAFLEAVTCTVDVTQRKRTEEALRASEAKFRAAIDGIAGLVAIMAPSGELESVNSPLTEYFGRNVDELKNWGTSDAVHPEDRPRVLEAYGTALAAGTPFHHELRLRRFDGEYRWFENRGAPIRDETGRITRWYCLLTDIEDRTQALARLQQMQSDFAHMNRVSVMGELAASLSHEITQPIASARNNARAAQNFLEMQPQDLGEVREALACVVSDADRAGEIIDRIREQIKKAPTRRERFDLNAAINEVIILARSVTNRNGVSVQARLSAGLAPVLGDRVQLQQVLLNLILNAAEAMGSVKEGLKELLISTEQDRAGVLVAVRDSGPGIDSAHLERVFDAFYTTKSSGTGMGLSICRSIIHAHGGKLWAEANEPRGVVFQFTLPDTDGELTSPLQVGHRTSELRERIE